MKPNIARLRPEQVLATTGSRSDVPIAIVVDSTALGQALGGCRLKPYAGWRDGVADAERLAAAMTEKCALAGLNYGGGKAVVAVPAGPPPTGAYRRDVLLDVGDTVAELDGRYATGPDIGTAPEDMSVIAARTAHVFCRPEADGGSGDSSGPTAAGILAAVNVLAEHERRRLTTASIVGLGQVGLRIACGLAAAGVRIVAADLDQRRQRPAEALGAAWVPVHDALRANVDLLVPAATGGLLTRDLVDEMRCRAVLGPANNQLDDPQTAEALHARGILWAPDPIVSAGGVIHATAIEREGLTAHEARRRVARIGGTLAAVLDEARRRGVSPAREARDRAAARLAGQSNS